MLAIGPGWTTDDHDHKGYVAGRYRNGALSDGWTDVARCAYRTFTAYYPACGCGWIGSAKPADAAGFRSAQYDWLHRHLLQRPGPGPLDDHDSGGAQLPDRNPAQDAAIFRRRLPVPRPSPRRSSTRER